MRCPIMAWLTQQAMFRRWLSGLGVVCLVIAAAVQINGQKQSSAESDEAAIRKAWQDYVAAWNKHDTRLLTGFFTEDVDRRTDDGRVSDGRAATLADIERFFGTNKDLTGVSLQVDIRFLTRDVAVMDARDDLRSTSIPGEPVQTNHTSIFVRKNGRWLTAAIRGWRIPPPTSR